MNSRLKTFIFAASSAIGAISLFAAPTPAAPAAAKVESPKSVFVMPKNAKEGCDPFFPNSQRPYISHPSENIDVTALSKLRVKSILPSGDHAFAIIGNHTFAPGDEGVVATPDGQKLRIRCIDINVKENAVTVEANGARTVLHFSSKP